MSGFSDPLHSPTHSAPPTNPLGCGCDCPSAHALCSPTHFGQGATFQNPQPRAQDLRPITIANEPPVEDVSQCACGQVPQMHHHSAPQLACNRASRQQCSNTAQQRCNRVGQQASNNVTTQPLMRLRPPFRSFFAFAHTFWPGASFQNPHPKAQDFAAKSHRQ